MSIARCRSTSWRASTPQPNASAVIDVALAGPGDKAASLSREHQSPWIAIGAVIDGPPPTRLTAGHVADDSLRPGGGPLESPTALPSNWRQPPPAPPVVVSARTLKAAHARRLVLHVTAFLLSLALERYLWLMATFDDPSGTGSRHAGNASRRPAVGGAYGPYRTELCSWDDVERALHSRLCRALLRRRVCRLPRWLIEATRARGSSII